MDLPMDLTPDVDVSNHEYLWGRGRITRYGVSISISCETCGATFVGEDFSDPAGAMEDASFQHVEYADRNTR